MEEMYSFMYVAILYLYRSLWLVADDVLYIALKTSRGKSTAATATLKHRWRRYSKGRTCLIVYLSKKTFILY